VREEHKINMISILELFHFIVISSSSSLLVVAVVVLLLLLLPYLPECRTTLRPPHK
jgi:hypothetical protein